MSQFVASVGVHQQGNPRGTPVHPPAILVPEVYLSAGGGPDLRLPRRVEIAGGVAANGVAVTSQAVDGLPQLRPLDVERGGIFSGTRTGLCR